MKNFCVILFCVFCPYLLSAQQGFKIGFHGALPVGDNQEVTSLALGVETGYMFALGEMADLGASIGFINGFPEKYNQAPGAPDLPHVQFLPIAASVRFWPANSLSLGGELGTALGINDGNDGGFYYRPTLGYLLGAQTELNLSYTGISADGGEWATLNLGILYTFPQNPR